MNLAVITGRIGRNPDIKTAEGKAAIANFSVATDEYYGGETHTEWHRCTAFGKIAEYMGAYVSKGALLEITGRLQTREWADKDGNKRQTTEIIVNTLKSLMKGEEKKPADKDKDGPDDGDKDIPF